MHSLRDSGWSEYCRAGWWIAATNTVAMSSAAGAKPTGSCSRIAQPTSASGLQENPWEVSFWAGPWHNYL